MHPAVCPETQRWMEAKEGVIGDGVGDGGGDGVGDGGGGERQERQRPRRGSQRQSKNQISPQEEFESVNSGSSSRRESVLQIVNQISPSTDPCLLSSRRGSHRQSRNQVSPQEEEFDCLNSSRGGSGRQSRVFSPENEHFNKESLQEKERTRGEKAEFGFERERVSNSKSERRRGDSADIPKTINGFCEEVLRSDCPREGMSSSCSQNHPLMLNSPRRPTDPSLLMLPDQVAGMILLLTY